MRYNYKTKDTCASEISFDMEGDKITNIVFKGGCDGNLKAIPRLIDGWSADEITEKCAGITCGRKRTSCVDQLVTAVRDAREKNSNTGV